MKDRRYIKIIRNRIILLTAFLILVCISFSTSYSNFIYKSSNHRAVEMLVNKLDYEFKINNVYTNEISIKPGNIILNTELTSLNEVETKYKLSYSNNSGINIFYLSEAPSGSILPNENKKIKLFVSNTSDKLIKIKFDVASGYSNNPLEDVKIKEGYTEISNTLSSGTNVNYSPVNSNDKYVVEKELSGYNKDQNVIKKSSKWKLLNVLDDGSINIISEQSITIDNKNNLLYLSGSNGYNNGVYLLNDICNKLYGSYNASARNLAIEDIESNLSKLWDYKTYYNPQTNNGYIKYEINTYTPKQYLNKLSKSEPGELITEEPYTKEEFLEINVDYWTHEMEYSNFNGTYYDIFMNPKYNTWLSSRYVNAFDSYALFGLSNIYDNTVSGNILYSSIGDTFTNGNAIRPVVNISSAIYMENNTIKIK